MNEQDNSGLFSRLKEKACQRRGELGLGLLALYVSLLALGTVGEIWEVQWILDLPIFRPPGKY